LSSKSNVELEKISLELEKESRSASALVTNFETRIEKTHAFERQLHGLAEDQNALVEDVKAVIQVLKELESKKKSITMDELLKRVAESKQFLAKAEKRRAAQQGKQEAVKISLKKIWKIEGKGG